MNRFNLLDKLKWSKIKNIVLVIIGVLLGFLFCNYAFFEFEDKINLVDLANLFVTVVVALFLSVYIQDKQNKSQKEKDFLINEINELNVFVKEIKVYSTRNNYPFESIKTTFKDFNIQVNFISEVIPENAKHDHENISHIFKSLRRIITNESPINGHINLPTTQKKNLVDKKLYELKLAIFELLKIVNKSI